MPPFREERLVDRGLPGKALEALERSGHLRRMAIVDTSYPIPRWAEEVDYRGRSSADALLGVVRLVPVEGVVEFMSPDPDDNREEAKEALETFNQVFVELESEIPELQDKVGERHRLDIDEPERVGFYSLVNNQEVDTFFIRTNDRHLYACATFIIGHSQVPESASSHEDIGQPKLGYATKEQLKEFAQKTSFYSVYDAQQIPTRLWNQLLSGVSDRATGLIEGRGEDAPELFKDPIKTHFSLFNEFAYINLDTLETLVLTGQLLKVPNLGKKADAFAREVIATRRAELEQ